jgi:threonine synthase
VPAVRKLLERGEIKPDEKVVIFNTGSGIKYIDVFDQGETARASRASKGLGALGPALRP